MVVKVAANGTGSQSALRRSNERHVMDALRDSGPISQATVARRVGLSRSAVNGIVRALAAEGLVTVRPGLNGRETEVTLDGPHGAMIAIDLGHRRMHGAVISFDRQERLDEVIDLDREHEGQSDVSTVAGLVDRLLTSAETPRDQVLRVCVGVHAPYETPSRSISPTGILPGWKEIDVQEVLAERLGLPVEVDNDANFAALAEWTWGAGKGTQDFLYIKSSNGIGSGLIINGRIYRGASGIAGEIGHVVVDDRGALCNCGNRGCLSAVASGRALLLQLAAAGSPRASLQKAIADALAGDLACRRLLTEAGRYIGIALSDAVKLIAPGAIAFGGELAAAGSMIFDSVRRELEASSLQTISSPPPLEQGMRRGDMCILGCVASVLDAEGRGLSDLPAWMLTTRGQRVMEYA